jgi:thiamine biosynthesis lipoprotein
MIRTIEFRAMNTAVMLAAEGEGAIAGMYAAKKFIEECEQRFSRFLSASELSELNRSSGQWAPVSDDLMDMLQLSMKYHTETNRIFDPSILSDLKRIGYDRSMDEIRSHGVKRSAEVSHPIGRPAFHEMEFDFTNNRLRLPRGMEIDLGGIAKGWIVEKAAQLLNRYVDTCGVSAGGDILFIGRPLDGLDWTVYLEDPRSPTETLAQLHIPTGAVATSSIMKRTWAQGEKIRHHLIDPRTGEPAATDWLSVTVISPSVIRAEVYAKAILIAGEQGLPGLLDGKKDLTFISVDSEGNLSGSVNYKEYMYELTSEPF